MLGITTPDAIAIGTLILAVLAALSGKKSGDAAKKVDPPPVTPLSLGMASFADTAAMMQLVAVIEELKEVLKAGVKANENRVADEVREINDKLDRMNERRGR